MIVNKTGSTGLSLPGQKVDLGSGPSTVAEQIPVREFNSLVEPAGKLLLSTDNLVLGRVKLNPDNSIDRRLEEDARKVITPCITDPSCHIDGLSVCVNWREEGKTALGELLDTVLKETNSWPEEPAIAMRHRANVRAAPVIAALEALDLGTYITVHLFTATDGAQASKEAMLWHADLGKQRDSKSLRVFETVSGPAGAEILPERLVPREELIALYDDPSVEREDLPFRYDELISASLSGQEQEVITLDIGEAACTLDGIVRGGVHRSQTLFLGTRLVMTLMASFEKE